jgi:hypothetical protein
MSTIFSALTIILVCILFVTEHKRKPQIIYKEFDGLVVVQGYDSRTKKTDTIVLDVKENDEESFEPKEGFIITKVRFGKVLKTESEK